MSNRYIHIHSTGSGLIPSASDISLGEIAVNVADGRLYTKDQNNNIVLLAAVNPVSASYATTASFATVTSGTIANAVSASYALTASYAANGGTTTGSFTGSFTGSGAALTGVISASYAGTDWGAINNRPIGIVSSSAQVNSGSFTGSFSGSITGSLVGTFAESMATKTTTYTASLLDSYLIGDTRSGSYTILLPNLTTVPTGYSITITKLFATASLIVSGSGSSQLINGAQAVTLNDPSSSIYLIATASLWILQPGFSSSFASTASYASNVIFSTITGLPVGLVSSSAQVNTGSFTGSFTGSGAALTGVVSASYAGTDWNAINNRPVGLVSSSVQVNSGSFSGSFTGSFSGNGAAITGVISSSYASTASVFLSTTSSVTSGSLTGSFTGSVIGYIAESTATKTTTYTSSILDSYLIGDTRSGSYAILLPDATTMLGRSITIVKPFATASLTVQASGSQTVNSQASIVMTDASSSVEVKASSSVWNLVGSFSSSFATTASYTTGLLGKQTIWIPAYSMWPRVTSGSNAVSQSQLIVSTSNHISLDFTTSLQSFAQFYIAMPSSWDKNGLTAQFYWTHLTSSVNFNVIWGIHTVALTNSSSITGSYNTPQEITGSGGVESYLYNTSQTANIAVGAPGNNDLISFEVYRSGSSSSDTLKAYARLIGVKILYTTNAFTDL